MGEEHHCLRAEVIEDMKKDIQELKRDSRELIRLNTLLENQIITTKEQGKVLTQVSNTMIIMNEYLNEQKEAFKTLVSKTTTNEQSIVNLNDKIDVQQIEYLKKNSIDILSIIKTILPYLIGFGTYMLFSNSDTFIKLFLK